MHQISGFCKKIFFLPVFDYREKTQAARLLTTMLWLQIIVILLFGIVPFVFLADAISRYLIMTAFIIPASAILIFICKHGAVKTASILNIVLLIMLINVFAFFDGGIHAPVFLTSFTTIVLAGYLLGTRGSLAITLCYGCAGFFFEYMETKGLLPHHFHPTLLAYFFSFIINCGIIVIFQFIGTRVLRHSLKETNAQIAERQLAETALRQREAYLVSLLDNFPHLTWLKDSDGRFLAVNKRFAIACGYTSPAELIGKTDLDVWPHELAEKYRSDDRTVMESRSQKLLEEIVYDAGVEKWNETYKSPIFDSQGNVIGTTGFGRDITEQKRTELALQNAEKLESLGLLAGGIAHDFNNLLSGVFGYIDLATLQIKSNDYKSATDSLVCARNVFYRTRSLTMQLLTFSKGGAPSIRTQQIADLVRDSVLFVLSGSDVSPVFNIPTDIRFCDIDNNQIAQVIDNITINARQAMPSGGLLTVDISNVNAQSVPAGLPQIPFVCISIRDQGAGISLENLPKIFDPFFTTKAKGSGLGLATSYSIVKKHGGRIDVESVLGKGSVFCVYLPASSGHVADEPALATDGFRGEGIVLVMDDEQFIVDIAEKQLKSMGFTVVTAQDGNEALSLVNIIYTSEKKLFAAILDLTVPNGRGGKEIAPQISAIDPSIRIIASSGYAEDPVITAPARFGFSAVLAKPYLMDNLISVLRRIT